MSARSKRKYYAVRPISDLRDMLRQGEELFGDRPVFHVKDEKGGAYRPITFRRFRQDVESLGTALMEGGLTGCRIAIIGENCYQWAVAYLAVVNGLGVAVPLDKELTRMEVANLVRAADCRAAFYTDTFAPMFEDASVELPLVHRVRMHVYRDNPPGEAEPSVVPIVSGDAESRTIPAASGERMEEVSTAAESKTIPTASGERMEEVSAAAKPERPTEWIDLIHEGRARLVAGDRRYLDCPLDPEAPHMVLYTSGTTGRPKGITLCHRNITSNMLDTCRIVRLFPTDKALSILPIHHTFECTLGILTVIYAGASVAFCEGLKYVQKNLQEAAPTLLVSVPLLLESVYQKIFKQADKSGRGRALRQAMKVNRRLRALGIHVEKKLFKAIHETLGGQLRLIVCGAAAIDPNVFRGYCELGFTIVQGYGLTECSPLVSGMPDFTANVKRPGSVGPVVAGGELKIEEPDGDGIGEICYRGSNLMLGYDQMPEETERVMRGGWFHTGDLGFLDRKGWLYLTGRVKNVIVTKTGKNIYPEELEIYINRQPYILESMVYGTEDDEAEGATVAVQVRPDFEEIAEKFGDKLSGEQLEKLMRKAINAVNELLPVYKRIRHILIREEEFIKTTTKKIRRQQSLG